MATEAEEAVLVDQRLGFLQWILGPDDGYVALSTRGARDGGWREEFFSWLNQQEEIKAWLRQSVVRGDTYFCPTLLRHPKRVKQNVEYSRVVWADLDECPVSSLLVAPTVVVQTSPGRLHAYWLLKQPEAAEDVEYVNKRIAYHHADEGCDKTGWDLTQYLRIPQTRNYKDPFNIYEVKVVWHKPRHTYSLTDFDVYAHVEHSEILDVPMPTAEEIAEVGNIDELLASIKASVSPRVWPLLENTPDIDTSEGWSGNLWQLEKLLFTAGLDRVQVFTIAKTAACNKYARDGKPEELLWKDVLRAEGYAQKEEKSHHIDADEVEDAWYVPKIPILTDDERKLAENTVTIVEEYIEWARTVGDAAVQYHEAGAFTLLSALLSGSVRLPTSYGTVVPNLWFMILADTTLTRKTTAMDLAMDMLVEIDADSILATDGSIEGMMTALSMRPGRASVFLRDEFSGFLEAITKKDYYAGMLETLTKLYDGKLQKRILRKETIEVRNPRLILFTGGIKENIYKLLTYEHINSGFVPRFCFITANADIKRLRPLGPRTERTTEGRDKILQRLTDLYNHYKVTPVKPEDGAPSDRLLDLGSVPREAELTPEAWMRYNEIEQVMMDMGQNSSVETILTPVMIRLCQSGLKAAILIAASERLIDGTIVIQKRHIIKAFYYVEKWKVHALNVVANAGKTATEKELEGVYHYICDHPGTQRGVLMQKFFLTARSADNVFSTLLQRQLVRMHKEGRAERYFPIRSVRPVRENS